MPTGQRNDPFMSYRFAIEINGIITGFAEASGLQSEVQTEDVREGGLNTYVHKLPKGTTYQNITLKRGLTNGDELWNWHRDVLEGKFDRKNISIVLLDNEGNETWRWNFEEVYPVKWTGPDLKASGSDIAFEALEFVHHGFERIKK
jgi:phage tail-like protein